MIDIILSAILSGVLKHGMAKTNVQFIAKQEVYNVTTTSVAPEEIKKEVHTPKVVAPEPVVPIAVAAPEPVAALVQTPKPEPPAPVGDYKDFKASGLHVHLALKERGNCAEPKLFMYAVWEESSVFYGCWMKINGQAHVVYDTGETQIYKVSQ